jgi:hypothetical protein
VNRAKSICLRLKYGATVLIVHHTGHAAKERARGSHALMADALQPLECRVANQSQYQPTSALARCTRFAVGEGRSGFTAGPSHFSAASLTYVAAASLHRG